MKNFIFFFVLIVGGAATTHWLLTIIDPAFVVWTPSLLLLFAIAISCWVDAHKINRYKWNHCSINPKKSGTYRVSKDGEILERFFSDTGYWDGVYGDFHWQEK